MVTYIAIPGLVVSVEGRGCSEWLTSFSNETSSESHMSEKWSMHALWVV